MLSETQYLTHLGLNWIAAVLLILLNYLAQVTLSQSVPKRTVDGTQKIRVGWWDFNYTALEASLPSTPQSHLAETEQGEKEESDAVVTGGSAGEGGQGLMLATASAPKAAQDTGLVCIELACRSR